MIPVKTITFEQVEGRTSELRGPQTFTSWAALEEHVRQCTLSAPKKGGGYYKCDVIVEWADGLRRVLRFDMQYEHGGEQTAVADEMISDLRFWSGEHCPFHMTKADYTTYLNTMDEMMPAPGVRARAKALLSDHDFGEAATS